MTTGVNESFDHEGGKHEFPPSRRGLLEADPHLDEHYVGEGIIHKVYQLVEGPAYGRLTGVDREVSLDAIADIVMTAVPGRQLVRFTYFDGQADREHAVPIQAGVVIDRAVLKYNRTMGDWMLVVPLQHVGHDTYRNDLELSLGTMFGCVFDDYDELPKVVIGREALARHFANRPLWTIQSSEPTATDMYADIELITRLRLHKIDRSLLGMNDSQCSLVAHWLCAYPFVMDDLYVDFNQITRGIEYILGIEDKASQSRLRNQILEELAEIVPLMPGDDNRILFRICADLGDDWPTSPYLPSLVKAPSWRTKIAARFADLYARRAAQLGDELDLLPQQPKAIDSEQPPIYRPFRRLAVFESRAPSNRDIREDLSYLRYLSANRRPVRVLARSEPAMRLALQNLYNFALLQANDGERREVLLGLQYMFDIQTLAQKEYFFELLCKRIALRVPLDDNGAPIDKYIGLAQTLAETDPWPPRGENRQPLPLAARTALMLSRLYAYHVQWRMGAEYAHNPDDAENAPAAPIVNTTSTRY